MTNFDRPQSLTLDGLGLPLQAALIIDRHGPVPRMTLAFWTGTNNRRALRRLDAALACGWFYEHAGKWRLSNGGKNALHRHRTAARVRKGE